MIDITAPNIIPNSKEPPTLEEITSTIGSKMGHKKNIGIAISGQIASPQIKKNKEKITINIIKPISPPIIPPFNQSFIPINQYPLEYTLKVFLSGIIKPKKEAPSKVQRALEGS